MRRMIVGIIVGLLIGTAGTALAASDFIQAEFAKFNLMINGEKQELVNEPIVVDGTTYWPLRELGEYLGFDIDYDDSTRTIVVNTPEKEELEKVIETENKPEVIEFETRNLNDFDTIEKAQARIAELHGYIDQFTLENKPTNRRLVEAELGMLEQKLVEMIADIDLNEDPQLSAEAIERRLEGLNISLTTLNAALNMSGLSEEAKLDYQQQKGRIESEIAELEAKKAQLQ